MKNQKINDCLHCKNRYEIKNTFTGPLRNYYDDPIVKCKKGHEYDGVMKSSFNAGFDIECNDFQELN
jgi:hypothetical protein